MHIISLIFPDKIVEYRRFFWLTRQNKRLSFLARLIGFKVDGRIVNPVYQPIFTIEKLTTGKYLEVHFSRWTSYVILINKSGIHGKWFDIRKKM
jgi:hypothetical protein